MPVSSETNRFASPASPLPEHELKMLQEYIHHQNVQIIGNVNPGKRQEIMLSQFFKSYKKQTVSVKMKQAEATKNILAKTEAVGRDFVILTTLFSKFWIPFRSIISAEQPYDQVNRSHSQHQQVVYDDVLKNKLLKRFGETVGQKEFLKQQFFDQTLAGHIRSLKKNRVTIVTNAMSFRVKLMDANAQQLMWMDRGSTRCVPWSQILWMEKHRFI